MNWLKMEELTLRAAKPSKILEIIDPNEARDILIIKE